MGFLDRFRTKAPARRARGGSGRGHFNGHIVPEEKNSSLTGRQGLQKFDEMWRTDPDIRRVGAMLINPLISATAEVEAYGGDEAEERDLTAAKATEWMLQSVMRPALPGHLAQALPILIRSGFAPFEQVWGTFDWDGRTLLAPKTLALRLPRTIHRFHQDGEELTGIQQLLDTGGVVDIPAEDLTYYRVGAEGDNWEGTSLLRPVYKPWFYKDGFERLVGIKAEREATGIPILYPPASGKTDEQLDEMEEILSELRSGERAFVIMPGPAAQHLGPQEAERGWHLDIVHQGQGADSGKGDLIQYLEYQSDKIAAAFLAEFMRLGQGQASVGARATAEVQQDPFTASIKALGEIITSGLQESLIERFIALNFEVEEPPRLKLALDDSIDLSALAEYVQKLVTAKALVADEPLEDFLREHAGLPPADPDERAALKEVTQAGREAILNPPEPPPTPPPGPPAPRPPAPAPATAPAPTPKPKADDPEKQTEAERERRWWEELMALDVIDSAITGARALFEHSAGDEARKLAREYAQAALAGRSVSSKPPAALIDAIAEELDQLYRTGQLTVRSELDAQRGSVPDIASSPDTPKELRRRATLAAQSIAARVWQRISQSVLARPGDQAAAQRAGELEAAAALRAEAQLHAAPALNLGRQDEADAHADEISGARYTSILDRNRCEQCALADDDVLRPLTDPVRMAHRPPNPDCYGGGRCRCMEFYELKDEVAGAPGTPPVNPLVSGPSPQPVASHFALRGGTAEQRQLVTDQLTAIEQVHKLPANMPANIEIRIQPIRNGAYGRFSFKWDRITTEVVGDPWLELSPSALNRDPAINSTVHEIGHLLDFLGFGDGHSMDVMPDAYLSSTPAMSEWLRAVKASAAWRVLERTGSSYQRSISELLARSYEQYIATRSGNGALLAKIEARRLEEKRELYWDDADFVAIAEAFDRLLVTRDLRS